MSCDRCVDVHNAQACGFISKSCECECHVSVTSGTDLTTFVTVCTDDGCSVKLNLNTD